MAMKMKLFRVKLNAFLHSFPPLLLFCLTTNLVVGQQTAVAGKVTDETGDPVPFASVWLNGTTKGTETDLNGEFTVPLEAGIFDQEITISCLGYQPQTLLWSIDDGISQQVEVVLKAGIDLPTILIVYEKPLIERDYCSCCCCILTAQKKNEAETDENTADFDVTGILTYPNPFVSQIYLKLDPKKPGTFTFQLFTEGGQLVFTDSQNLTVGQQTVRQLPPQQVLPEGIYFLHIIEDGRAVKTERVVKVRP